MSRLILKCFVEIGVKSNKAIILPTLSNDTH